MGRCDRVLALAMAGAAVMASSSSWAQAADVYKEAAAGGRPYLVCVMGKAKALAATDPDDGHVAQAAKAQCEAELKAYSQWLEGKGYDKQVSGVSLTTAQRTASTYAEKAAALGRAPPR